MFVSDASNIRMLDSFENCKVVFRLPNVMDV